jgi:hypothetical protein
MNTYFAKKQNVSTSVKSINQDKKADTKWFRDQNF